MFEGAQRVTAARGKQSVVFDLARGEVDRAELEKHVLGPTGNLRAPALRLGKTWLVGFGDEVYAEFFG